MYAYVYDIIVLYTYGMEFEFDIPFTLARYELIPQPKLKTN